MADPISLIGIGASAGGSLISGLGALMGGGSQSQMYGYQAGLAQLRQKIALQNRDYAYATGETEAQRYGMQARQRMGAIKAGIGASGIDIGSGSKADIQTSQQGVTDIDMAQIRNNTARKAYGFEIDATMEGAQANLYTKAASDAKSSGMIKAMGSLLSGTSSVADKWLQGKSLGLWSSGSSYDSGVASFNSGSGIY